jgi:hypothetical protein
MKKLLFMLMAVLIMFSGTALAQVVSHLTVAVDIEPDNKFNIFKYKEEGMLTVAVLGTNSFDAAEQIIPASITVNKMKVRFIDDMPVYDVRDMNGDGIEDLVVLIDVEGQYFQPGKRNFALTGKLKTEYGGTMILGKDLVEILHKMDDPDHVGWYNMMNGNQRLVYDSMLETFFYPHLNAMLDMTRAQHQEFIDKMNATKYGGISDWVFASYEQSDGMKWSFGLMADNLEEYSFGPPGPRTPSSPYLAWTVVPGDYFDITSVQMLPPIFGDLPVLTLNGRIYSGWSIRRDGMDMGLPPDVAMRLGNADDHFVATALRTTGVNGTITFNHDTHGILDHETTRAGFPGPLGAWVASVKGPRHLNVTVDVEPDNKFNYFVFKEEGIHTVAIMGKKFFDVAKMVDPASVTMNKMKVARIDNKPVYEVRDMNGDGIDDLVLMIAVEGKFYKPGRTVAVVKGKLKKLYGGLAILGTNPMTILAKKGDPDFTGWYNMTNGDQRLVYDAMLDAYFYPHLNNMLDMTRKGHQEFINHLNKNKYGNITDWVFANYEQSDGMKMSFALMAENLEEYSFGPPGPRGPSSPYLAWTVVPADYFDITSVQMLPPIFGDLPVMTLNGRIYSGWSIRRDGMDMGLPPDVAMRLGNADDHFVATALRTPGVNGTITFNHDTHDLMDHETTRAGFPGPLGAWVAAVKGPKYLSIAVDVKPGDDKNEIPFCAGEVMAVALLGNKFFDVAEMVDPASIMVAKMKVKLVDGEPVYHVADVNGDGVNDLVAAVVMNNEKDMDCFTASVTGVLKANYGGAAVLGHDLVKFVGDVNGTLAVEPQVSNYPNPFNPETHITFQIPQDAMVSITIFNALGQVVRTLSNNVTYEAGEHQVRWDARDAHGLDVASGVYIYRFKANDFMQVKRMLLIR